MFTAALKETKMALLDDFCSIKDKYSDFVFTNYNAKGELVDRVVYIYAKNDRRRGKVLFEIWKLPTEGRFDLYVKRILLTGEEYQESLNSWNKTTGTRGRITRDFESYQELVSFVAARLDLL
jgi:hypothetical protein